MINELESEVDVAKKTTAKCQQCEKAFKPSKTWQRFCSPKCRDEWHNEETRKAKAAWRKEHPGA
jgi:predicted RNA-binding Zn-ribbon protein involved in translation (DUF1610 family)